MGEATWGHTGFGASDSKVMTISIMDIAIHGWLLDSGSSVGRPVDFIFSPEDGALYISDDQAGVIYRVTQEH